MEKLRSRILTLNSSLTTTLTTTPLATILTAGLILNASFSHSCCAAELNHTPDRAPYSLGTELDALPFATGGYYFSLVGGYDHFRLRGIASLVYPPSFAYPSDRFSNLKLHAYALIVDYFFKPAPEGFWVGAGIEKWLGTLDSNQGASSGSYNESVATLGVGYVWIFYQHFYLNPWAAAHVKLSGDSPNVGAQVYSLPSLQGEGSVKLGWYF